MMTSGRLLKRTSIMHIKIGLGIEVNKGIILIPNLKIEKSISKWEICSCTVKRPKLGLPKPVLQPSRAKYKPPIPKMVGSLYKARGRRLS